MIKPTYNISDKVYHITPESELGIVIDASYSLLTGRWLYQVTFSPHSEALCIMYTNYQQIKLIKKMKLTQSIFENKSSEIDWCGVDYDGLLHFGIAINPRYTYASERWRGFDEIGDPIEKSGYKPLTSLRRDE